MRLGHAPTQPADFATLGVQARRELTVKGVKAVSHIGHRPSFISVRSSRC